MILNRILLVNSMKSPNFDQTEDECQKHEC